MVNIVVGRLDNMEKISVEAGTSVASALRVAGYTIGDHEEIQDISGNVYSGEEEVEEVEIGVHDLKEKDMQRVLEVLEFKKQNLKL